MIQFDGETLKYFLTIWGPLALGWSVAGLLGWVVYKLVSKILEIQEKLTTALDTIARQHTSN